MEKQIDSLLHEITTAQKNILENLEKIRHDVGETNGFSARAADALCSFIGSWRYIFFQSILIFVWMALNICVDWKWDNYPFILLNLILSFQAATASPIILMAQNRSAQKDRKRALAAYQSIDNIESTLTIIKDKVNLVRRNGYEKPPGVEESNG